MSNNEPKSKDTTPQPALDDEASTASKDDMKVRAAREGILKNLEPITPGLFLSIAPSTIPATNVASYRSQRRKTPARTAPNVTARPVMPQQVRGQVRPPQMRPTPPRRV